MAVALMNKNYNTSHCVFSFDNWTADKVFLPDLKKRGNGALSSIPPICQGSLAYGIDGTAYILNGNNEWVTYHGGSGGGGFIDLNGESNNSQTGNGSSSNNDSSNTNKDENGFVDLEENGGV